MDIDGFIEYCEENKDLECDCDSGGPHDKYLKKIFNDPHIINLRNPEFKYKQVALYEEDSQIGEIDLVFVSPEEEVYICEVKVSKKEGHGGFKQLRRGYNFIRDNFEITPTRIFVRRDPHFALEREIIKPNIWDILRLARLSS